MRVPELKISMCESAVGSKSAVALVVELALDRLVVAVWLAVKELLLFAHLVDILPGQGLLE